jgi:hypothetical protein
MPREALEGGWRIALTKISTSRAVKGSFLEDALRASLGALDHEVHHASAFEVGGFLNEKLLGLVQADVEAICPRTGC